jgi:predicted RNA-binding protein with RPS1 domain
MRRLTAEDIPAWVRDVLLSPHRKQPIVAATSHPRSSRAWKDPAELEQALAGEAEVVLLETGDATWALSEALPERLDVYGGALRIWWPGLTRESDPYDHRLYCVFSPADAVRVFEQIVTAVTGRTGRAAGRSAGATGHPPGRPAPVAAPAVTPAPAAPLPPETVRVTAVAPGRVEVASAARRGLLTEADLPLDLIADSVTEGCEFRARPLRPQGDGTWTFSIAGTVANAWERFVAEVQIGDVVTARVQNLYQAKGLVFVDVLPGVVGVCHIRELDYGPTDHMEEFARPGDLLSFKVLELDDPSMKLQLSRKRAHGQPTRRLPALIEGGRPFEWRQGMPQFESLRQRRGRGEEQDSRVRALASRAPSPADAEPLSRAEERNGSLEAELSAANAERANLVAQIRELRQQAQELRKELRASEDRFQALERKTAGELNPLSSERAFLLAVRLWYARQFDEDDRMARRLQRMRVGPQFLASLRTLDGIDLDKVLEVCAQVAAGVAHTIPARDVHQLRAGSRGAGSRTRARDGAQAWRCALQLKTPSARRLHWWNVPGPEGATIEFAAVGVHDDFDIPE